MTQLTPSEKVEPIMLTWGRIVERTVYSNDKRLKALVNKMNEDFKTAKVEENFFELKRIVKRQP